MTNGCSKNSGDSTNKSSESQLQAQIILEVCNRFGDAITIWRSNTGAFHDGKRLIRFGVVGQADVSGIMKPLGCRIEIEVKRPGGKQSQAQKNFQRMMLAHGGLYLLCDGDIEGQVITPIKERLERDQRVIR